jgi:CopG antitoxin of type II toxin-antitoxin system
MTTVTQHKKPIPDFNSRKKMAEWFDSHDMTDYDFKPVDLKFDLEKPKEETVMFRLDKGIKQYLAQLARTKGLNTSSLLRMWIMEKFNQIHRAPLTGNAK